jgi:uncharacterized membrane protein
MAQVETAVRIAAPIEAVYVFFVPQRMPYWYGAEMAACLHAQGGAANFAVGQTVGIAGHLGKRMVSHTAVVTALHRPSLFEWRFEDEYGVQGLERWELAEENGTQSASRATTVLMRSQYVMPGVFAKMMDWLITSRAVARRNRSYLLRLKRLAEHGPAN